MTCEHMNFKIGASVGRLKQTDGGPVTHYCADIRINCTDCGMEFEFFGLPGGLSAYRPTVSMDGLELRVPITPPGTSPPKGLPGFAVRMPETEQ